MKKTIGTQSIDQLFAKIDEHVTKVKPQRPPNSVTALEYAEKRNVDYCAARRILEKLVRGGTMQRTAMYYNGAKTNFYTLT